MINYTAQTLNTLLKIISRQYRLEKISLKVTMSLRSLINDIAGKMLEATMKKIIKWWKKLSQAELVPTTKGKRDKPIPVSFTGASRVEKKDVTKVKMDIITGKTLTEAHVQPILQLWGVQQLFLSSALLNINSIHDYMKKQMKGNVSRVKKSSAYLIGATILGVVKRCLHNFLVIGGATDDHLAALLTAEIARFNISRKLSLLPFSDPGLSSITICEVSAIEKKKTRASKRCKKFSREILEKGVSMVRVQALAANAGATVRAGSKTWLKVVYDVPYYSFYDYSLPEHWREQTSIKSAKDMKLAIVFDQILKDADMDMGRFELESRSKKKESVRSKKVVSKRRKPSAAVVMVAKKKSTKIVDLTDWYGPTIPSSKKLTKKKTSRGTIMAAGRKRHHAVRKTSIS